MLRMLQIESCLHMVAANEEVKASKFSKNSQTYLYSYFHFRGPPTGYIEGLEKRLAETEAALFIALSQLGTGEDTITGHLQHSSQDIFERFESRRVIQTRTERSSLWNRLPLDSESGRQDWWQESLEKIISPQNLSMLPSVRSHSSPNQHSTHRNDRTLPSSTLSATSSPGLAASTIRTGQTQLTTKASAVGTGAQIRQENTTTPTLEMDADVVGESAPHYGAENGDLRGDIVQHHELSNETTINLNFMSQHVIWVMGNIDPSPNSISSHVGTEVAVVLESRNKIGSKKGTVPEESAYLTADAGLI